MPQACCVSGLQQMAVTTYGDWYVQQLLNSEDGRLFLGDVHRQFVRLDGRAQALREGEELRTPDIKGALAEFISRPLFMTAAAVSGKLVGFLAFSSLVLSGSGQIKAVLAGEEEQQQQLRDLRQEEEQQFTEWQALVRFHRPLLRKWHRWIEEPRLGIDRTHLNRTSQLKWLVMGAADLLMATLVPFEGPAAAGLSSHTGRIMGVGFSLASFLFNSEALVQSLFYGRKDLKLSDAVHDVADAYCRLLQDMHRKRGARNLEPALPLPPMTELTVMSIDTDSWATDRLSTRVGWDLREHYFKLELSTRAIRTPWVPLRRGKKGEEPNLTLRFRLPLEIDGDELMTFKAIFNAGLFNVADTCHFKVAVLRQEDEFERRGVTGGSMRFKVKRILA